MFFKRVNFNSAAFICINDNTLEQKWPKKQVWIIYWEGCAPVCLGQKPQFEEAMANEPKMQRIMGTRKTDGFFFLESGADLKVPVECSTIS